MTIESGMVIDTPSSHKNASHQRACMRLTVASCVMILAITGDIIRPALSQDADATSQEAASQNVVSQMRQQMDASNRFSGSATAPVNAFVDDISTTSSSNFKPIRRSRPPTQEPVRESVDELTQAPSPFRATRNDVAVLPNPVTSEPLPRRRRSDEDPFAPVGINVGSLNLKPAFEVSGGYDSNPLRRSSPNVKGSSLIRTEAELQLQSDWSVHALTGGLRGSYQWFTDLSGTDRPELDGRLTYRHDFLRDTQGEFEVRGRLDTQRPGSPDLTSAVRDRPAVYNYGASTGVTQTFNRLSLGLRGSIYRNDFEDATLTNGTILPQGDRNVTEYSARLRVAYELTPGIKPFIEGQLDTRIHDDRIDNAGFERDSTGLTGRVGSTFELTRLLTGEISAGYQERYYEDARLKDLRGPIAEGSLVWAVTPLTNVKITLASSLDDTSLPNASGIINQRARLEVTHDLWRNLTLGTSIAFEHADYRGISLKEEALSLGAKLDYRVNRAWVVRTSFTHERLKSSSIGSDYTANIFLAGLRLQR